jgi:uncharacterized protein (TIGR02145 family)
MGKIYTFNDKIITINNKWCEEYVEPPAPPPSFDEVTIGTQTWMSKNLAIDDGQGGIESVNVGVVNGVDMGTMYFYTWTAATRIANNITGWHLPSFNELLALQTAIGGEENGNKLKSTAGWSYNGNGTDDYGFGAYPVGRINISGVYGLAGEQVNYWLSDIDNSAARQFYFETSTYVWTDYTNISTAKYCVRLIKDT